MKRKSKTSKQPMHSGGKPRSMLTMQHSPTMGTCLALPGGEPDLEVLRSVTREWLVPRLVEKFLRVHAIELKYAHQITNRERSSLTGAGPLSRRPTTSKEVRSQAKKKNEYQDLM